MVSRFILSRSKGGRGIGDLGSWMRGYFWSLDLRRGRVGGERGEGRRGGEREGGEKNCMCPLIDLGFQFDVLF